MKSLAAFAMLIALTGCESGASGMSAAGPDRMQVPSAERRAEQRGATYATTHCAGCHAVGSVGDSPLAQAPRFRELGRRYPVADLSEAFAEGIVTAHPAMPQFALTPTENADLIAYLQSIQVARDR